MAYCEDYPCCGHTDGLPCDWVAPDYSDPAVAAAHHIGCDHNTGHCDYEDEADDLEDEDEDELEDEPVLPSWATTGVPLEQQQYDDDY